MLRTLFIEEARTQVGRNASVTGACCLVLLGFLGLWWLLADVPALAGLMQLASMAVIIVIPVAVMVQVAVEYWQSMYGQRGYLTMAVPVRGRVHFAAKALYACVVVLVEGVICLGGLIACAHAMEHYGIALQESPGSRLHIIAPYDQHPVDGIGRVIIHRNAGAPIDPLGSPFADQETAILTFMRCTSELDALIALDCALRGGLVTRAQLLARLRGPRNGPMRALLARADPKARSLHPGDHRPIRAGGGRRSAGGRR